MITRIETHNFRCLRYLDQPLERFHVLVGPNGSGKTTFLDVVAFLQDLLNRGIDEAVGERTDDFRDLVWGREEPSFEIAVEAAVPEAIRSQLHVPTYETVRYEISIALESASKGTVIRQERGWLKGPSTVGERQRTLFPCPSSPPPTILTSKSRRQARMLFSKKPGGNDNFYSEVHEREGRWAPSYKLGPRKSTLANLPEDETKFPASAWFKRLLTDGIEQITLNSLRMRLASPPGQGTGFKPDGSNLPWVVDDLAKSAPHRLREWVSHVRSVLPDLKEIRTVLRDDDRHRYLVVRYASGLEVPSWVVSDGTLRLLALTLPAYLERLAGIYLIEEPENGIHPRAVEAVLQSLSSVYQSQILLATHSPVILNSVDANDVLCFGKTSDGITDVVRGSKHPRLADWLKNRDENLGTLFAAGVLS
ncbi:MAG: AAA family ATPase [Planctomycetia bacterium]|nr:AAA family ATPase [Planctomycetia bacterium]